MGFGPASCGVWPSQLWGLTLPAVGIDQAGCWLGPASSRGGPASCGVWPSWLWGLAQPAVGFGPASSGGGPAGCWVGPAGCWVDPAGSGGGQASCGVGHAGYRSIKSCGLYGGWVAHVIFESPKSQLDHRKLRKLDMKNPSPRYFDLDYNFTWLRSCKNEFVRNLFSTSLLYSYILN